MDCSPSLIFIYRVFFLFASYYHLKFFCSSYPQNNEQGFRSVVVGQFFTLMKNLLFLI
jgi:hypothetical protein